MDDKPVHLTTNEARAGSTPRIGRYVLAASLTLIVIVYLVLGFARGF